MYAYPSFQRQGSSFYYVIAVVAVIIAIILAFYIGSQDVKDLNDNDQRTGNIIGWLFLAAITFGLLAIVQQNREKKS